MLGRVGLFLILTAVVAAAQSTIPITGATSYATRCAVCHGGAGSGTDRGPSIIRSLVQSSDEDLVSVITSSKKRWLIVAVIHSHYVRSISTILNM